MLLLRCKRKTSQCRFFSPNGVSITTSADQAVAGTVAARPAWGDGLTLLFFGGGGRTFYLPLDNKNPFQHISTGCRVCLLLLCPAISPPQITQAHLTYYLLPRENLVSLAKSSDARDIYFPVLNVRMGKHWLRILARHPDFSTNFVLFVPGIVDKIQYKKACSNHQLVQT